MLTCYMSFVMQQSKKSHRANPNSVLAKKMAEVGYIPVSVAAKRAGVHRSTVHRWTESGGLPSQNLDGAIFVKVVDLEAILKRREEAKTWRSKVPSTREPS